jgi:copper(I)-binding protein
MKLITTRLPSLRGLMVGCLVLCGLTLGLAACGDDDDTSGGEGASIDDAWGPPTAPGAEVGAFYLDLTNNSDTEDRVVGVGADGCTRTELHQISMTDGVTEMREAGIEDLTVGAGEVLTFEPNGLHIMCVGPIEPLEQGTNIALKLELETAGVVVASIAIEDR